MLDFQSIRELVEKSSQAGMRISDLVLEQQAMEMERPAIALLNEMTENLKVMKEAIHSGLQPGLRSAGGLIRGAAGKLQEAVEKGRTLGSGILDKTLIKALAAAETNASMGKIVAAPTAGSCGVLPSVLITVMEGKNIPERDAVMGLFTAAGVGLVIAKRATVSGAEGGCQAECGSASAMAAAAAVEMMGGTPQMASHACAIALKNVLGLVCDPVAGLVEVPCVKRNAAGAANALVAADLALAGIESVIPADEVIDAMKLVGNLMGPALRETAQRGLAATPTGRRLAGEIYGRVDV